MASKKSKGNSPGTKKDSKHGGKNGKKGEGLSGSSFFTWFMVIALLGVWTSVAVVWFDLVDYEDILGKLGVYDADGDGDFDVEDAKILLGLKESSSEVHPTPAVDEEVQPVVQPPVESEPEIAETEEEEIEQATHEALRSERDEEDYYQADQHEAEDEIPDEDDYYQADEHEAEDEIPEEFELELEPEEIVYEQDLQAETEPDVEVSYKEEIQEEPEPETEHVEVEEETVAEHQTEEEPEPETQPEEVEEEMLTEDQAGEESEPETRPEEEEETVTEDEAEEEPEPETKPEEEEETVTEDQTEDQHEEEQRVTEEEHKEPESEPEVLTEPEEEVQNEEEVQEAVYEEPVYSEVEVDSEDQDQTQQYYQEEEIQEAVPVDESVDEAAVPLPEPDYKYTDKEEESEVTEDAPASQEEAEILEEHPADEETQEEVLLQEDETEKQEDAPTEVIETDEPSETNDLRDEAPHVESESTHTEEKKQEDSAVKKKKPKLLNKFDKTIKAELDAAEKLRKRGKTEAAVKAFEDLVTRFPQSPRARYGKAQSEDDLAEKQRSNEMLQKAISMYGEVADLPNAPADLVKLSLKRRAERQQFLGRMRGSLITLHKLVKLFPDDLSLKNDLGVGYLLVGDNAEAKKVYEEVLTTAPDNGFAQVHYGFILKAENKIAESIPYLQRGLESGEPGTDDGRFYFHLGDALQRVGSNEAYTWYEIGHQRGHFASVWQRSLYNVEGLKAQPWWTAKETGYTELVKALEKNWKVVRDEGLSVMNTEKALFLPEDENLRETGDWGQFTLWQQGRKNENACKRVPRTCALMERFPESTGCKRGQVKYSIMQPGTHVWPHTGPTNCRIRMHLGLVIPKDGCKIRCGNSTRTWEEGKVLIFDDSFEHEVWQEATSFRLIFIVDVWHPELTFHQRRTLSPI